MNNFIKLNSSFLDHPDHFEFVKTPVLSESSRLFRIFSETLNFSKTRDIWRDFENVVILKEREGDNFGIRDFEGFRFYKRKGRLHYVKLKMSRF